ncbi:F-box/kelch-repeat protein SKIP4 [Linum grandiflorum]
MEAGCARAEGIEGDDTQQLLRGLPDDITLFCLARVPRKYHSVLKGVCRRWRDLVCGEEWHEYRKKNKLAETWIYALCRGKYDMLNLYVLDPNPSRRCWKLITGIPDRCLKRKGVGFEAFGKKIYLLGGCGWSEDTTEEVYCYDVPRNLWTQVASLPTARCYFACEVVDGKIYAMGGLGSNPSDLSSCDLFDPNTNACESHPNTAIVSEINDSIVLDGKMYIRYTSNVVASNACAIVYDPTSETWEHADDDLVSGWRGPAVAVEGDIYVLDESSGTKLIKWDREKRGWVKVGRLSSLLTRPPCQLIEIEKRIFMVGTGLSTVVVDVSRSGIMDGAMVTSSIPGLNTPTHDEIVVSCTSVSI